MTKSFETKPYVFVYLVYKVLAKKYFVFIISLTFSMSESILSVLNGLFNLKGAFKYYISALEGGGGSDRNC